MPRRLESTPERERARRYYAANRGKVRARIEKWHADHPGKREEWSARQRAELRHNAIMAYGGYECACKHTDGQCGISEPKYLGLDHINGGGHAHRKAMAQAGHNTYTWLRANNYPLGFQVLCHNCNQAKGLYGRCPEAI